MAGSEANQMQNTVRQLLTSLDELSSSLSCQRNDRVESEVRRVFTAGQRSAPSNRSTDGIQPTQASCNNNSSNAVTANSTTTLQQSNVPQLAPGNHHRNYLARRNFSGQRPSHTTRSTRRQKKSSLIDNRPFMRDLILLGGPETVHVPRQGARLTLMENGHVISGCRFTKGMTAAQVEITIMQAFDGKIPENVDIELLMSMHTSLIVPALAPILQCLFQTKPIYIRPSRKLLTSANDMPIQVRLFSCSFILEKCSLSLYSSVYSSLE